MVYYLIQYAKGEKKGEYKVVTRTAYKSPIAAFNDGMAMHRKLDGDYAGFAVKDKLGHTIHRVRKEEKKQC